MIELNLLPWREQAEKKLKKDRIAVLLSAIALSIAIMTPIHLLLNSNLVVEIAELKHLEQQLQNISAQWEKSKPMYQQ
ncbi:MAG TPA: hypothetical protein VHA13_04345, partial [Gammaproteobacteria bacterium]|nr:hypothetical protein [Gammaproteobacteria bacterium]